jgi:serine/threonine-protein kinase HipA
MFRSTKTRRSRRLERLPVLPRSESADLESVIAAQAEKIGGVQPKLTVDVSSDGMTLEPSEGGRFIVKPQWQRKHLPQNEHLSMCLARLVGVEAASCALLPQMDGTLVYVTKRFDRVDDYSTQNYHQLDFCQLLSLPQDNKYRSFCRLVHQDHH